VTRQYFVGIVVVRDGPNGSQFLLLPSRSILSQYKHQKTKTKFAGGSSFPNESLRDAASRELWEETWLRLKDGVELKFLCLISKKDHDQVFYMVRESDCEGQLRNSLIFDGKDLLYLPFWADGEVAYELVYKTHQRPLHRALELLSDKCLVG
jgi:8-oxo-dGTP pyrophosphatase MutT (NUDIX family)